jgi:hypothetical protein
MAVERLNTANDSCFDDQGRLYNTALFIRLSRRIHWTGTLPIGDDSGEFNSHNSGIRFSAKVYYNWNINNGNKIAVWQILSL